MRSGCALIGLVVALTVGAMAPAAAEFFGCNDKNSVRTYTGAQRQQASRNFTHEFAAQASRPRVTIYPRKSYAGRNSVRQCRATLVKEYRVSGTVIVPHQQCWWE
jgi:hypothetical protein